MNENYLIIGNQEWCALPSLGVKAVKVRIDSGAATSAIHADQIEPFEQNDEQWLSYRLNPIPDVENITLYCESKVFSTRQIKSSNGIVQKRYVIETLLNIGNQEHKIKMTLANRDEMGFRMLLGREAMENIMIAPSKAFLLGEKSLEEVLALYEKDR
ncbi:MAG: ATP-dependent zinc protease family protein [Arenicella sp.]